jgi:hypothetical protein
MSRRQLARGESQSPETIAESEVSKERGKHEEDNLVAGETNKKAKLLAVATSLSPALVSHLHPHPHPIPVDQLIPPTS